MPDAIAGSHGDPAHSVDGQVQTAQAGTRSPLRTGAPLSTHIRVISCGRHAQRLSRSAAALTSRCSFPAPAAGGHSQGAGRVGSESPRSLLTDSCVIQSPPGCAQMQDEQTVQEGQRVRCPGPQREATPAVGQQFPAGREAPGKRRTAATAHSPKTGSKATARVGQTGGSG